MSRDRRPNVAVIIIDGAAVVDMLKPEISKTFGSYANEVFLPFLQRQLQSATNHVDIAWTSAGQTG